MNNHISTTRRALILLIGFFIPISTALTNIFCPLALILILVEGHYRQKLVLLRRHPIAILATSLFLLIILSSFHTPVTLHEIGLMLEKYRELLYISIFLHLFRDETDRRLGIYAFLSAMAITLCLSYLVAITGWQIGKGVSENAFIFKNYITQSLLMALAAYFLAILAWQTQKWRRLTSLIIFLIIYNILFLSEGRTGYLILFCLILLFSYQTYRWRGILVGMAFIGLLSFLAYNYSTALQKRMTHLAENIQAFQQGTALTSTGMRIEFAQNSMKLLMTKPIFGHGTGSFSHEYEQIAKQQGTIATNNPHNEYLMLGVQWGIIGISLFIYLLYLMWHLTASLPSPQAWLAQGLIITMSVGCLVNSLLLDSTEGHLFAYFTGLFYSQLMNEKEIINKQLTLTRQLTHLLLITLLLILGLTLYPLVAPRFHVKAPIIVDKQIATIMQIQMKLLANGKNSDNFNAIGFDTKGIPMKVNTKFQPRLESQGISGNNLTISPSEQVTISNRLEIDKSHIKQAAHLLILASYQNQQTEILFQRAGKLWEPLDFNQMKSAIYYPQLPASIEVPIYQGPLTVTGQIKVFVAYYLEDNTLVLNAEPIQISINK